jgi:hypothetical protein
MRVVSRMLMPDGHVRIFFEPEEEKKGVPALPGETWSQAFKRLVASKHDDRSSN